MSEGLKVHAAWYPARLYKYYVEGVERNKIIINEYFTFETFICHVGGVQDSVHIYE